MFWSRFVKRILHLTKLHLKSERYNELQMLVCSDTISHHFLINSIRSSLRNHPPTHQYIHPSTTNKPNFPKPKLKATISIWQSVPSCFHYSCFSHLKVKFRLDFEMTQLIAFCVVICPTSNGDANLWPKGNETMSCDVIKNAGQLYSPVYLAIKPTAR